MKRLGMGVFITILSVCCFCLPSLSRAGDDDDRRLDKPQPAAKQAQSVVEGFGPLVESAKARGRQSWERFETWYRTTPPVDRVVWGGLLAAATLSAGTALERSWRLRKKNVVPTAFTARFRDRLGDGRLDRGKTVDLCELNPSPAARIVLAGVKRWGRPTTDVERAIALARRVEIDRLRRHVGTLKRVAGLAPLLGLLGSLSAAGRALANLPAGGAWGPPIAAALAPLTASVTLAIIALAIYDALAGRVEVLDGELDRLGAETVDGVAISAGLPTPRIAPARTPHQQQKPKARSEPAPIDDDDDDDWNRKSK